MRILCKGLMYNNFQQYSASRFFFFWVLKLKHIDGFLFFIGKTCETSFSNKNQILIVNYFSPKIYFWQHDNQKKKKKLKYPRKRFSVFLVFHRNGYIQRKVTEQQHHPTNAMAHLQQTQREALLYLLFYWVAYSPRWLVISPQKLRSPVFAISNNKPLPPHSSFYRSLNTHTQTLHVFICPSVVVKDVNVL